jgi:hypothetical protein
MTKLAPLRTIEHGLRRSLAILEAEGAKSAIQDLLGIKRSASLLHKCADPDNDRHHLQLRYAVALDVACQKAGQLPPLLEVYRYLVERHGGGQAPKEASGEVSVLRAVLDLQSALGELSQTVRDGLHVESPGGVRLTNLERHEIYEALVAMDHQSESIKHMMAQS